MRIHVQNTLLTRTNTIEILPSLQEYHNSISRQCIQYYTVRPGKKKKKESNDKEKGRKNLK